MDLEERTIEHLPSRCENCGNPLSNAEKQAILDSPGAPALCSICAAEEVPLGGGAEGDEP